MNNKCLFLFGILILLLLSCSSRKDFVYLQNMDTFSSYATNAKYEAIVHSDDRLNIVVSSANPELAIPFNRFENFGTGMISNHTEEEFRASSEKGYRVDSDGCIYMPILGKIYVDGLTIQNVRTKIENKIKEGGYIKEPIVTVEFVGFRFSVLGAVNHVGTFTVEDGGRVTIFDAIARAGDISFHAKLNHVKVIREENGVRKMFQVDLRDKEILDSPVFYLQQNDIVYVEPKYKDKERESKIIQYCTLAVGFVSAIGTLIWAINL